jgi:hypothetical protein
VSVALVRRYAGAGSGVRSATDEFFFAIRGRAPRNEGRCGAAGTEPDFCMAGPKPLVQRLGSSPDEIAASADRITGASAVQGADGSLMPLCGRPEP